MISKASSEFTGLHWLRDDSELEDDDEYHFSFDFCLIFAPGVE